MRKKIVSLILLCAVGISSLYGCADKSKETSATVEEEYTPVNVETVENRTISEQSTFSGKVSPNKDVMVTPKIPGKVTRLNVEVGSRVSLGQVLFTVDKEDLQKQVDQARKQVELVRSNYNRSKEQIGQASKQVELAESNYEKVKEQVDNAKVNLERTKKLYEEGIIPKSQYEQAELAASDTSLKTLEIQIEQAKLGATDSALGTAQIQIEQAELAHAQALDALKNTNITAPSSGVVSQVNINQGEMASSAQPSIVILDTSKMYVEIDVPENIISKLSIGESVDINIGSTQDELKGKVELISPAPDDRTRLYLVKISMNEVPTTVKTGMFAKVNIDINSKEDVVAVNSDSIIDDGTESYVYILDKDRAVKRKVSLGINSGEYTEVTEGVKAGEVILVKGQNYVEDGSKVKVIRGEE